MRPFILSMARRNHHNLDPDGDVLLTLHNPNAPFAVWDPDWYKDVPSSPLPEQNDAKSQNSDRSEFNDQTQPEAHSETGQSSPASDQPSTTSTSPSSSQVKFRVSSKHLCLASEYFKRLLQGPWKEATSTSEDGLRHVDAYHWDQEAMLTLMQIIHGRNYHLPLYPTLEYLAKIAVLVDYYQCHEAVSLWAGKWLLSINIANVFDRDTILTILVGQVFKESGLSEKAARVAMRECPGKLPTLGLPITTVAGGLGSDIY
ncbi:uncharacterized protein F4812DRAFT_404132 [Daldinia caldariorum]|uniref:uncharacterized protein n=1 Tax=Daldinia caldariorum TaxID=326644 RepID=UPI0020076098|nr:uncharacterized protein F4812DRAFT_404132 [Daldinia caldariorum]KAI1467648.1 hypothetical protein F4812DRAFT_404132 [Daldinia caldariorum]